MSDLERALSELVDQLTEHSIEMRDLLATICADPDSLTRFIPTIRSTVERYDAFMEGDR